jgi:hypothetical protein
VTESEPVAKGKRDPYLVFLHSLRKLMDKYEGQYVAVVGGAVVAHGGDAEKVYEKACKTYPTERILIGQVPVKEAMVLWAAFVFRFRHKDQKHLES